MISTFRASLLASALTLAAAPAGAAPATDTTDITAPFARYSTVSSTSADYAGPMVVTVGQDYLNHDPARQVTREIDWGTGAGFTPWRGRTDVAEHAYTHPGHYAIYVRLTDRAGNSNVLEVGAITVTDQFAPEVTVRPAAAGPKVSGQVRDTGGSGVAGVAVRAAQLRDRGWFSYTTRGWRHSGQRGDALRAADAAPATVTSGGTWSISLAGAAPARRLVVRAVGRDRAGNRSLPVLAYPRS